MSEREMSPGDLMQAAARQLQQEFAEIVKHDEPDIALNHFFLKLMSHLAFFRKRTTLDFEGILGPGQAKAMTIQGYQYNLKRSLVPAEMAHREGTFENPKTRFILYSRADRVLLGQICYWPWQDGAVITCSVRFDHMLIFKHYFRSLGQQGSVMRAGPGYNLWFSSVLPISESDFINASKEIHPDMIVVRDSSGNEPPPATLDDIEE